MLVPAEETANGSEIYISQKDIREVQLAKGAIAAGIQINKFITHKESPLNYYNFILFSELFIFYAKYIKKQYF